MVTDITRNYKNTKRFGGTRCTLNVQHGGEVESDEGEGGSDLQSAFVGMGSCMSLCACLWVSVSYTRRTTHTQHKRHCSFRPTQLSFSHRARTSCK